MKLLNIEIFFLNKQSSKASGRPCRNSAPDFDKIKQYHQWFINKSRITENCMNATTITIGCKWLGSKSADDQYKQFVKDIKKHILFHSDIKYIYHFELQNNGMLHAHGIEYNSYRNKFICDFDSYGKRNRHKKAFMPINNMEKYLAYINKENAYPPITNLTRRDLASVAEAPEPENGDGNEF